ncbi:hypothetical protein AVEN_272075-1 [Araneus ventricosus]|uniref:DUF4817 domain-containing protein n=1 Tax=Araneus ventricosus TaxID=182803 RepID=A0A4Y2PLJ7_ARAVE|nr:hypothetical protein AVEN_272075-1 [Araneus ventricosus]
MPLKKEEHIDIIPLAGSGTTTRHVAPTFNAMHRTYITHDTVEKLITKFRRTCSVADGKRSGRPETATDEAKKTYLNRNSQNNSTIARIVHPTTKLTSPTKPFFSSLLEHSMPEIDNQFQCLRVEPHVHHTSNFSSTASRKSTWDFSRTQSLV